MTEEMRLSRADGAMKSLMHRGWRGHVISAYADPATLDRFIAIHDAIRRGEATVIQDKGGRVVAVLRLSTHGESVPLLFKQDDFMRSSFRTLLKSNLRPSHMQKSWRHTLQLRAAGIPVPAPVALLERRRCGVLHTTVYAGEYLPNAVSLAHLLRRGDGAGTDGDALLARLARELRFMHDRGFYHGDLKADNILAERRADRWLITFIDLEGVVAKQCLTEKARAIDLGRLWWALMPLTTPAVWTRFLEAYTEITPSLDRTLLKQQVERRVDYLKARRFGDLPAIGAQLRGNNRSQRWLIIALGTPQEVASTAPLLVALRRWLPNVRLDVLVCAAAVTALAKCPAVHTTISLLPRAMIRTIRTLRSNHYDATVDVTTSIRSSILTSLSGAGIRIGYRTSSVISKWFKRTTCYTQMIVAKPEQRRPVNHYLLVAEALGFCNGELASFDFRPPENRPEIANVIQNGPR